MLRWYSDKGTIVLITNFLEKLIDMDMAFGKYKYIEDFDAEYSRGDFWGSPVFVLSIVEVVFRGHWFAC